MNVFKLATGPAKVMKAENHKIHYPGLRTLAKRALMSSKNAPGTVQATEKGLARQSIERNCERSGIP